MIVRIGDRRPYRVVCLAAISALAVSVSACSSGCVQDQPPLVRLDGVVLVADLGRPPLGVRPAGDPVFVAGPKDADTAACGWRPADGESNMPQGTEIFLTEQGTYVVELDHGVFALTSG